jgi:hypothetical protein
MLFRDMLAVIYGQRLVCSHEMPSNPGGSSTRAKGSKKQPSQRSHGSQFHGSRR